MREDRSVLELLKADYTFLNERLAKHYGIQNVYGSRFRRVQLGPELNMRRGLLGQGSMLTVTSIADNPATMGPAFPDSDPFSDPYLFPDMARAAR